MVPLRIVVVGAELGVMIEVPARELARGDAARRRVEQPEDPRRQRVRPREHVVMQDLVQQDREVEDREALHERERHPDQRVFEANQSPGRQREDRELPQRDREVPGRRLAMEPPQFVARNGTAELGLELNGMVRVVPGFHGGSIVTRGFRLPPSPRYGCGDRAAGAVLVSATPSRTAAAPTTFRARSGSPRKITAVAIATSGIRFE